MYKKTIVWATEVINQLKLESLSTRLLLKLSATSDEFGRVYNVSLHTLARECGLSCLKVVRAIRKLVKSKIIYADIKGKFYYLRINLPAQTFNELEG